MYVVERDAGERRAVAHDHARYRQHVTAAKREQERSVSYEYSLTQNNPILNVHNKQAQKPLTFCS